MSRAPYNFVPLNKEVVPGQPPSYGDRYHPKLLSGRIDLTITTLTPLYIRGEGADFFRGAGGRPAIPGSTLRGMVRTLVEIASWGKFNSFEDRRFHYRAVYERSSLNLLYTSKMTSTTGRNISPAAKAGVLARKNGGYEILESPRVCRVKGNICGNDFVYSNPRGKKENFPLFSFKEVSFNNVQPRRRTRGVVTLSYEIAEEVSSKPSLYPLKGYLWSSGNFPGRKHMQWIIEKPGSGASRLPVPPEVIKKYREDTTRTEKVDLLKLLESHREVPCFYITDGFGNISAIGHTGFFRLPYEKTIADHVPDALKNPLDKQKNPITDMAEAIFGREAQWASRVFFEDAPAAPDQDLEHFLSAETALQVLGSPKPTAFPHYLEQPNDHNTDIGNLNHWDSEANLRGYKLYWHRDAAPARWKGKIEFSGPKLREFLIIHGHPEAGNLDRVLNAGVANGSLGQNNDRYTCREYFEDLNEPLKSILRDFALGSSECQHTVVTPARPKKKFHGRVRFENLSPEELGALLFVLDLPAHCHHKLGMGKPLGLGSVSIELRLALVSSQDRGDSYTALFCDEDPCRWRTGLHFVNNSEIESYQGQFAKYVLQDENADCQALWDDTRMRLLKIMLGWGMAGVNGWERTRYLNLEVEFRERRPLPKPDSV